MKNLLERPLWAPALFLILLISLFRSFLWESLWLDETVTVWVVKDGFLQTFPRAFYFQGQSPFYYLLISPLYNLAGLNEAILRIPSVVFIAVSLWVLYKIAAAVFSREAAGTVLIAFIALDPIVIAGFSARPYALALMTSLLSIYFLLKWSVSKSPLHGIAATLFFVATLYAHPLFAPIAAVHLMIVLRALNLREYRFIHRFFFFLSLVTLLLLPVIVQVGYLFIRKDSLHFTSIPTFERLLTSIAPPYFAFYCLGALLVSRIMAGPFNLRKGRGSESLSPQFLAVWLLLAPVSLFAISIFTGKSLFIARYFLWSYPALALMIGAFLDRIGNLRALRLLITAFALFIIIRESGRIWHLERWREAVRYVNDKNASDSSPIFVSSGLIEGVDLSFYTDPLKRSYLLSPVGAYGLNGRVLPVPRAIENPTLAAYFQAVILPLLKGSQEFRLICLAQMSLTSPPVPVCDNISSFLATAGHVQQDKNIFGEVEVRRFSVAK